MSAQEVSIAVFSTIVDAHAHIKSKEGQGFVLEKNIETFENVSYDNLTRRNQVSDDASGHTWAVIMRR